MKYIAWLNGSSVAVGTLSEVEQEAKEVFESTRYQARAKEETTFTVTTNGKQTFIKSVVWRKLT